MKKLFFIFRWIGASVAAFLLLSGFVFFYSNTGVHINNPDGSTDYVWMPGQIKATASEGYAFFRMDRNGFNNVSTKERNIDILLMGSSQMEAVNVHPTKNTASIINGLNEELYCYNIGISGHQPITQIDAKGMFIEKDVEHRMAFSQACTNLNIRYIDMTDDFKNYYESKHVLAHGFNNTAVGVGHLNEHGHMLIAKRIAEEIKK